MRKKAGILLMLLGFSLICSAGAMIAVNRSQEQAGQKAAAAAQAAVEEKITEHLREEPVPAPRPLPPAQPPAPKVLEAQEVEGQPYIGTLQLPVLELELPIMADWSYKRLRAAPCREYGTTARDMVIAGHNYRSHFGRLNTLVPGDVVTFTDMEGQVTAYEVGAVETILPTDIDKVRDPQWQLVLYTCTYGGHSRVMVGCTALEPTV